MVQQVQRYSSFHKLIRIVNCGFETYCTAACAVRRKLYRYNTEWSTGKNMAYPDVS